MAEENTDLLTTARCVVLPGDGIVARWRTGVGYFTAGPQILDRLLDAVDHGDLSHLPSVATTLDWFADGGGFLIIQSGRGRLETTGTGFCDFVVGGTRRAPSNDPVPNATRIGGIDRRRAAIPSIDHTLAKLDLEAGIVPGGGFLLQFPDPRSISESGEREGEQQLAAEEGAMAECVDKTPDESANIELAPMPPRPPDKDDEPSLSGEAQRTEPEPLPPVPHLLEADAAEVSLAREIDQVEHFSVQEKPKGDRGPLPIGSTEDETGVEVVGINCPINHFNAPHARYCWRCGREMNQLTATPVRGIRPLLGFVTVVEDGRSFSLHQDYEIGRQPELSAKGGTIQLGGDRVSRRHASLRLENWDVLLVDNNSRNSTTWRPPEGDEWQSAEPGQPVRLEPGTQIRIAEQWTLRFELIGPQRRN